jgi:hypothetical protein
MQQMHSAEVAPGMAWQRQQKKKYRAEEEIQSCQPKRQHTDALVNNSAQVP